MVLRSRARVQPRGVGIFPASIAIPRRAFRPQFDEPRLAPTAGRQSTIFPSELLPLGDIDACTGKNHTEVEPRDDLDSVKPQANRFVNQLSAPSTVAGRRRYRIVKSYGPTDLVFQSVKTGAAMRDNNILSRHIKPTARKLGLPWVNWRCLRTSHATWMIEAGANPKDVQGQMRHSRISTTMDIYAQFVPESQRRALGKMSAMVAARTSKPIAVRTEKVAVEPQSRMVN